MIHPFFDPKELSESDLDKKLGEINSQILIVHSTSGNLYLLDQMIAIRDSIYEEMQERAVIEEAKLDRGTSMIIGGKETENG